MSFESVIFSVDGPVGRVTLNRPEARNAYSLQMRDELWQIFDACRLDTSLKVVVIRGEGGSFCAGADLTEFGSAPSPFVARRIRFARDVWGSLAKIPVPVIAALHGHVIGSGLELALLSTLRVSAQSAVLVMPEARLGLMPAAAGTQTLPRLIGFRHARELLYLGQPITAADAFAIGLVDALVEDDALEQRVQTLALELAERPRAHLVRVVRLLRLQDSLSVGEAERVERLLSRAAGAARCPT